MGVIANGKVSGTIPNSQEAFVIHYPGYPSSTSRAVETLGGIEAINKVRCSESNKLELRFRPADPYSHPAFGALRPCKNLLLKISKKKSSVCPDQSEPETENPVAISEYGIQPERKQIKLCADIVARVSESYCFNGMVDYQHVTSVHADAARKMKRKWEDLESHLGKGSLMDMDQEDIMTLVPPLFSPKDIPEKIVLRPSALISNKNQEDIAEQVCEVEDYLIDFNIAEIPKKIEWERQFPRGSSDFLWQSAVCKLFDEKPIWPKRSLNERLRDQGLKFKFLTLKRFLFNAGYYFGNGPFHRFWIRREYDPRKDPESRIYQRIDYRVPPSLRTNLDADVGNELKNRWEDLCKFQVFPNKCQVSLQFCELVDDYIQQEIRKPPKLTVCTRATGWFTVHMVEHLRLRIAMRFLSVYPGPGAESALKSATDLFSKSKRTLILKNNPRPSKAEDQKVNKELLADEMEQPDGVADDEIEEFEYEEELDAYESHLHYEDAEIFLQQSSTLGEENISRSYLQQLFGTFPHSEASAGQIQDDDTNDGEYQIYEQDSDGNYMDDDDD